jgi:hypothetical protein
MGPGDHGIIVASVTISELIEEKAETLPDKTIPFIEGQEFVERRFGEGLTFLF